MAKKAPAGGGAAAAAHRRALFVEAYIANGGNATEAAKAAGFSAKTAHAKGHSLVNEPKVAAAIEARRAKLQAAHGLTTERILLELRRIALADPRKLFGEDGQLKGIHELDDDTAAALASVDNEELFDGHGKDRERIGDLKKIRLWDKVAAIDKAMKHLGLFEKDNAQAKQSITIVATPQDQAL